MLKLQTLFENALNEHGSTCPGIVSLTLLY